LAWKVALCLLFVVVIFYAFFTGPRNLSQYPPAANSPYYLPWPAGITWRCVQGNRGVVSHRGFEEFSYDFAMPVGSDVCAARAGKVSWVVDSHVGNGIRAPNNAIAIQHDDGTEAWYLHIKQHGAAVKRGDLVQRGQRIAASGNVGRSMMPHLHFHVSAPNVNHIPFTFTDVSTDRGIPRMFKSYTSQNTAPSK
jgi:murein DD-endopeptidase MepM/ murein hydrolase activator NlpD